MKTTINPIIDRSAIISALTEAISQYDVIHKAWIFGSFARGDHHAMSDIDVVVEADDRLSLMSLFGIQEQMSSMLGQKIDIGFMNTLKPEIRSNIEPDLIEIFNRFTSPNHHEKNKKQIIRKIEPHVEFHP
jgi:predicted nucleotidyltransferase